eukprot:6207865-Pleurochrysis_carterae.AAC.1
MSPVRTRYGELGSNNDCSFHRAFPNELTKSNHGPYDGRRCTNWHQNFFFVWTMARQVVERSSGRRS